MPVQDTSAEYKKSEGSNPSDYSPEGQTEKPLRQILQETIWKAGDGREDLLKGVKEQTQSMLSDQKVRLATELESFAGAFYDAGKKLHENDHALVAHYTEQTARYAHQFSQYLQDREVSEIIIDAGGYVKRNPAVFIGGALAVGFLFGRFMAGSRKAGDREG